MSTPDAVEKGKHRIEQYQAFFDVLTERADAYAKRGAHKAAWKLLAKIEEDRHYAASVLATPTDELVQNTAELVNCLYYLPHAVMRLVEELAKVHLSLVSRSVSNAVKEIGRMKRSDTDLGALAAVIKHYFSA